MDIFDEMRRLHEEMDSIFRNFFNFEKKFSEFKGIKQPLTDIKQTDKDVIVEVELPGVNKEDIKLQVTNDILEVRAKKEHHVEVRKKNLFKQERSFSGYYRKIALPVEVKGEETQAEFKNSILKVKIPKAKLKLAKKILIK